MRDEYVGVEALSRAKSLTRVKADPDIWEVEYRDEATGEIWLLDYPHSEQHGGGSPRLRKARLGIQT
ncbi:MAG: immunity 27 family protein [Proteobacteria bacterium]|nr:immunity 27 family protein [Pseudomonadota bacterium]